MIFQRFSASPCSFRPLSALVAAGLLAFSAQGVSAQGQNEVTIIDLGTFGFHTLSVLGPSFLHRPYDTFGIRPDAAAMGVGGAYTARSADAFSTAWTPAGLVGVDGFVVSSDAVLMSSSGAVSNFPTVLQIPQSPPLEVIRYDNKLKSNRRPGGIAMALPIWDGGSRKIVGAFSWLRKANPVYAEQAVQDLLIDIGGGSEVTIAVDRDEKGSVETFGPSLGIQLAPGISVGATANIMRGRFRANGTTTVNTGGGGSPAPGQLRFTQTYSGFTYEVGAKVVAFSDRVSLAAKFAPEYTLEVSGGAYDLKSVVAPGTPATRFVGSLAEYDLTIPSAMNIGVALQPFPKLWISADLETQKLGDSEIEYTAEVPADTPTPFHAYEDVSNVRVGAEFVAFNPSWATIPLRVGYRTVDLGFREPSGDDYTYLYSYQAPGLSEGQRNAIDDFQTIGVIYDGTPSGVGVDGSAYSFGFSLQLAQVTYDVGFDVLTYEEKKFNLDSSWDPTFNPNPVEGERRPRDAEGVPLPATVLHPGLISIDRSITNTRLSATFRF